MVILIGLQLVPVDRSNPPEHGRPAAPTEVQALLQRACYDCHSNQTQWPWYSRIAPLSFWLAQDVKEGRRELNFSTWGKYDQRRKTRKLKEVAEQVERGDMPLWYYLPLHPEAELSAQDRELIIQWARHGGTNSEPLR